MSISVKHFPNLLSFINLQIFRCLNRTSSSKCIFISWLNAFESNRIRWPVHQFLYLKTKLLKKDFNSTHLQYLDTSNLLIAELLCYIQFYTQTYDSTISYVKNTVSNPSLRQYVMDLLEKSKSSYAYKKPWLAASLSIIPGLGQIYTKQYTDSYLGVLPFYLHGSIAYLSFSQAGVQSIFGWVNMALASGFYFGNIYGAGQSAKRINQINYKKTVHEIEERIASLEF